MLTFISQARGPLHLLAFQVTCLKFREVHAKKYAITIIICIYSYSRKKRLPHINVMANILCIEFMKKGHERKTGFK